MSKVMLHACVITLRNWCFVRARERERETEGEERESEGKKEGEIERKQRERWRVSVRGGFGKWSSAKNDAAAYMCNNNATK